MRKPLTTLSSRPSLAQETEGRGQALHPVAGLQREEEGEQEHEQDVEGGGYMEQEEGGYLMGGFVKDKKNLLGGRD